MAKFTKAQAIEINRLLSTIDNESFAAGVYSIDNPETAVGFEEKAKQAKADLLTLLGL